MSSSPKLQHARDIAVGDSLPTVSRWPVATVTRFPTGVRVTFEGTQFTRWFEPTEAIIVDKD